MEEVYNGTAVLDKDGTTYAGAAGGDTAAGSTLQNDAGKAMDLLEAIANGEYLLAVTVTDTKGIVSDTGYTGVKGIFDPQGNMTVCTLEGSAEALSGIWRQLQEFGSLLAEDAGKGQNGEQIGPCCSLVFTPGIATGGFYIELDMPQFWAYTAETFGAPADRLKMAFTSRFCTAEELDFGKANQQPADDWNTWPGL